MTDLSAEIREAAQRKIRSHEGRTQRAYEEWVRKNRRSSANYPRPRVESPRLWSVGPEFDPYLVRAKAAVIGHSMAGKLRQQMWTPLAPAGFYLSKPGGGERLVTSFAIADEVVSRRTFRRILEKNRARLSAHSYAYRDDLNVHDAISHLQAEWQQEYRVFVAQYDFADFFGSIDHDHLWRCIGALGLAITRAERRIISGLLQAPRPTPRARNPRGTEPNTRGVHQGTSLSLLLANIAATPLDRGLERLGVSFARYADDIVIWSRDYASINRAVDELHRFAESAGCPLNQDKSHGVRLLVPDDGSKAEIAATHGVEFLSHSVGLRTTSMAPRIIENFKRRTDSLVFNHLLREPLAGTQDMTRLDHGLDRDYVALIWQLRRNLYGNLSEQRVRSLLRGALPDGIRLNGLIAQLPLADDTEQLRQLDAWLSTQLWLALRRRQLILASRTWAKPNPWGWTRSALIDFQATSFRTGALVDVRMPSAARMRELVRRAVQAHGTAATSYGGSLYGSP